MNRPARTHRPSPRLASRLLRKRSPWPLALLAGVTIVAVLLLASGPLRAQRAGSAHQGHHASTAMTDEAMRAHAEAYWATHEPVGVSTEAPQAPQAIAATFSVANFIFELGQPGQVDTAKIAVGDMVRWQYSSGLHTVTNGTDSSDPNAGSLFNAPIDLGHLQFIYTFNTAGTYPFFCSFHEFQNMKGVVVVSPPNAVEPSGDQARLGFTRGPIPNPTSSGMTIHYALRTAGRATAEVFDASGRRVAVLVNRDLPAGSFTASWDGRSAGAPVKTGVYYVRLRLPGYDASRQVVVRR